MWIFNLLFGRPTDKQEETVVGSNKSQLFPEVQQKTNAEEATRLAAEAQRQAEITLTERRIRDKKRLFLRIDSQVRWVFQDYAYALGFQGKIISDPEKCRWYWGDLRNPGRELLLKMGNQNEGFYFSIRGDKLGTDIWDRDLYGVSDTTEGHTIPELVALLRRCEA